MPIEVKKKEKETVQSLLRRFSRRIQQSGVLVRAKRGRFYTAPLTKRQKKINAIRRAKNQTQKEKLYKLGKLPAIEGRFRR
jgi:ribosomal protein S21